MKKVICITVTLLVLTSTCFAADITTNILQRVLLIKYGESLGTCFTIDVDKKQYIVTAKHVVKGIKDNQSISIMNGQRWQAIPVKTIKVTPDEVDIIVLVADGQLTPSHELEPSIGNMILGQQMYFLGFPYGISMNEVKILSLNNGYPLPLIKSGLLSAMSVVEKPDLYYILVLDGLNNEGFSGGPIVYKDIESNKLKVCGVIAGYLPQDDQVYRKIPLKQPDPKTGKKYKVDKKTDTKLVVETNSGLVVGYSINLAVDAIKKSPNGPAVTQ